MRRDPTEFRQRFAAWKDGENYWDTREYTLPEYSGGKSGKRSRFLYTMDSEHFEANPYVDDVGVKTSGYGFTRNMDTIKNALDRSYTKEEARRVLEKEMDHRLLRTYGYLNPDIRLIIQSNPQLEEMLGDALWQSPNGYGGKKSSLVAALNSRSLYGNDEQAYWNNIAALFTRGNYYTKKDGTRIRLGGVIKRNNARALAFKNMYKPKQKKASTITEPIVNNLEQVERPLMLPDHPVLQTPLQAAELAKLPKTIQRNLEHLKYPVLGNDYWENFLNSNSLLQFQSLILPLLTGYKRGKNKPGVFGGGSFDGAGSGDSWDDVSEDTYHVSNFNQAFDLAVSDGLKEFIFQGRRYNTQKENNPVREFNNRWVGLGRRANVKNPSTAYDHLFGPLRGPLTAIPMIVDTYIGSPERPPVLDYNPSVKATGEDLLLNRGFLEDVFFPTYILRSKKITPAGYKHGKNPIHINPANRGKFNALKKRTGKTTELLTHSKNPLTRKRAIFALNSRKFKH